MEEDDFGELDELNEQQVNQEFGEGAEFEKEGFEEGDFDDGYEGGEFGDDFIPAAMNGKIPFC